MNRKLNTLILLFTLTLTILCVFSSAQVKAESSDANILSYSWYVAPANNVIAQYPGDLAVVGEVQNTGSSNLGYVIVSGTAFDSNGTFLASAQTTAFGTDILPGQKEPFYIDLSATSGQTGDLSWVPQVSNVTVSVDYVNTTSTTLYSGITITNTNVSHDSSGIYTVTGAVQNIGSQNTGYVWVVTTFYNASGTVVSLSYTDFLTNSLAPGASVAFTATPAENYDQLSSQITNSTSIVQSRAAPTATAQPSTMPTSPTPTATATTTQPTQTPTSTIGTDNSIYIAAAVIVIVIVAVAAVLLVRGRVKKAAV
jgi:hypothetical protein